MFGVWSGIGWNCDSFNDKGVGRAPSTFSGLPDVEGKKEKKKKSSLPSFYPGFLAPRLIFPFLRGQRPCLHRGYCVPSRRCRFFLEFFFHDKNVGVSPSSHVFLATSLFVGFAAA